MQQDEELHAELMTAFSNYFKANQKWINKGTRRAAIEVRFWLSEIRRICSLWLKHVREMRMYLEDIKKQKKIQNQTGTAPDIDT
jgi:hypothetical protein